MKAHLSAMLLVVLSGVFSVQALHDAPVGTSPDVVSTSSRQRVSYTYDEAGNRTSRTIVLQSASRQSTKKGSAVKKEQDKMHTPLSDMLEKQKVTIYPNPTQGRLIVHIAGGDRSEPITCHVYDTQGTLLLQKSIEADCMNELDLLAMPSGIYLLCLHAGNSSLEYKIIKQ